MQVELKKIKDWIELTVHSQGQAIAQEEQKIIFSEFKRAKSADVEGQKGWGIGLPLVQGISRAHGGDVWLESESHKGTTFTVRLPLRNYSHP